MSDDDKAFIGILILLAIIAALWFPHTYTAYTCGCCC